MGKLLYFFILLPLSWLPFSALYTLSYLLYFCLFYVFRYRKEIVFQNISKSFPEMDANSHLQIAKDYFRHFADVIVEGIKSLSISEKSLKKRYRVINPEIANNFFEKNKSIILCAGHVNNWEWWITHQNKALQHQAIGIGMPLTQKSLGAKINERRERMGMIVTDSLQYKAAIKTLEDQVFALLILGDQSPGSVKKSYWTTFLHQETAFTFGTEMIANTYNLPVIYYSVRKVKRGFYELELKILTEEPLSLPYGKLTEKYVSALEHDIINQPSQWIWSHKRWKKEVPNDLNSIKNEHQKHFNTRFRSN